MFGSIASLVDRWNDRGSALAGTAALKLGAGRVYLGLIAGNGRV